MRASVSATRDLFLFSFSENGLHFGIDGNVGLRKSVDLVFGSAAQRETGRSG